MGGLILPRKKPMTSVENSKVVTKNIAVLEVCLDTASRAWTTLQHNVKDAQRTCRAQGSRGEGSEGSRKQRRMHMMQSVNLRAAARSRCSAMKTRWRRFFQRLRDGLARLRELT